MSSTGQTIGAIGGAVIGFFVAGPAGAIKGAAYGAAIGGYIDPPPGPNLRGPTLDDKSFQSAAYGVSLPRLYGTIATMGNIIYLENNEYKAVSKKESQGGKGGGGGTYETTTYFATFAVALAEAMPGSAIRRIWAGGKLIYSANADDMGSVLQSHENQNNWRYYDGTQTAPDARMEAALGVGNCPSYEGTAYIIFYDFELTDYGNGLAGCPIKAEIVAVDVDEVASFTPRFLRTYDTPKLKRSHGCSSIFYNGNFYCIPRLTFGPVAEGSSAPYYYGPVAGGGVDYGVASLPRSGEDEPVTLTRMHHGTNSQSRGWYSYMWGQGAERRYYAYSEGAGEVEFGLASDWYLQGIGHVVHVRGGLGFSYMRQAEFVSNPEYFIVCNGEYLPVAYYAAFGFSDSGLMCVVDGQSTDAGNIPRDIKLYEVGGGFTLVKSFSVVLPPIDGANPVFVSGDFIYIFGVPNHTGVDYWVIDAVSETIRDTGFVEFNLDYFSPDGFASLMWGYESGVFGVSCPLNDPEGDAARFVYFTLSNASSVVNVPAPGIVTSILEFCGIDNVNADEINGDYVDGYAVSALTSGRAMLKPIQVALFFDLVERGYALYCVKRTDVAVATVPYEHLIPVSDGKIIHTEITQESQLPSRYTLNYIEYNREYDAGSESALYPSHHENHRVEELPVVISTDRAAQLADVLCRLSWIERYSFSFRLPQIYLHLQLADVINVEVGPGRYRLVRIDSLDKAADQTITVNARSASFGAYSSNATGAPVPAPPETVPFVGNSRGFLLDIPMILEAQNNYGIVATMSGEGKWPGGVLMDSADAGQTFTTLTAFYSQGTIANTQDILPASDGLVMDRTSSLTVSPFAGEFFSLTEAQMMTGKNYCAYGADGRWEIIQYATAVVNADSTVTLSIFVRGLFGTEWATGLHQSGDVIVLLDDPDNQFVGLPSSAVGVERQYKSVTVGKSPADVTAVPLTYRGVNLKPLSVVNVSGARNVSNDWVVNFFARTRYQSNFWVTGVQPQNEPQLQFEIDILNGGTVVRTLSTTIESFTYTEAQQIADFGSAQNTLSIIIYQISAAVGRGYPRAVQL